MHFEPPIIAASSTPGAVGKWSRDHPGSWICVFGELKPVAFRVVREATREEYIACCRRNGVDPEPVSDPYFYEIQVD